MKWIWHGLKMNFKFWCKLCDPKLLAATPRKKSSFPVNRPEVHIERRIIAYTYWVLLKPKNKLRNSAQSHRDRDAWPTPAPCWIYILKLQNLQHTWKYGFWVHSYQQWRCIRFDNLSCFSYPILIFQVQSLERAEESTFVIKIVDDMIRSQKDLFMVSETLCIQLQILSAQCLVNSTRQYTQTTDRFAIDIPTTLWTCTRVFQNSHVQIIGENIVSIFPLGLRRRVGLHRVTVSVQPVWPWAKPATLSIQLGKCV